MARKKDTPCARCGTLIWRPAKNQSPTGGAMCNPCRGRSSVKAAEHGTRLMYRERACRCGECRGWAAARQREYGRRIKARDGISPTQKYRPGKSRRAEHPCASCGVVVYGESKSPTCAKCRARDKRGIQIPRAERIAIYERDGWACGFCTEPVDPGLSGSNLWGPTLDHVIPRSKGGSDGAENLRLVHRYCNSIRRDADALTLDELAA